MVCMRCGCEYTETVAACPMCGASPEQPPEAEAAEKSSATVEISKDEIRDCGSEKSAQPVRYGGFWIRCFAAMLDGVVLGFISLLIYAAAIFIIRPQFGEIAESMKALFIPQLVADALMKAFYFIYFHAVTGQTVGKKALGLKVVGVNGQPIGYACSAGRYIGSAISLLVFGLGYFWVGFDSRKQGWHDKMAGSFVVRV
jgi:uncharacterized RDD family membrane protein YckC